MATAQSLAVDRVTGEVVGALRATGIPTILLKGPTVASWLYDEGAVRYYMDSDLLVEPARHGEAEAVLRRLGFRPGTVTKAPPKGEIPHAHPWSRAADRAEVDLHRTLSGLGVSPEEAWNALSSLTEQMSVGGTTVDVLRLPGRALLVALHAAQHGPDKAKPIDDLARALDRAPTSIWRDATTLAFRLDATPGFASGLRLMPEGAELAERLGLVSNELVRSATGPGATARVAIGIDRLAHAPSLSSRIKLLVREFFPPPSFLRWWSPLARRGRLGLLVAYLWRPLWLLRHAPASLRVWRRNRHDADGARQ